jgi:ethanolamine transporter
MTFAELRDLLLDGKPFVKSCRRFQDHVDPALIVGSITALFTVFAGFDFINENKYGYGEKYNAAWEAMAPMAVSMVGITSLTPVMRVFLTPIISPIFKALAANPAMFAGALLDPGMGGFQLAKKLAPDDYGIAMYSSVVLGTMLGCTIVFNIPVGLAMTQQKNHIFFAYGTLIGIVSVPIGCILGGLSMTVTPYPISAGDVFLNVIPIVIIALIIGIPLYVFPFATLRGFMYFSGAITFLMTFGAILAIFQQQTTLRFPVWSLMIDDEGENSLTIVMATITGIAMVLTGTIPMVHFVTSLIGPLLQKAAQKIGLTQIDAAGIVGSLATAVPMYGLFDTMSKKGMVFNGAFEVGAAYAIGDHLAYLASVEPDMIIPMLVAKLSAGIVSLVISVLSADMFVRKGEEALAAQGGDEKADGEADKAVKDSSDSPQEISAGNTAEDV